jgi:hypothetical protein
MAKNKNNDPKHAAAITTAALAATATPPITPPPAGTVVGEVLGEVDDGNGKKTRKPYSSNIIIDPLTNAEIPLLDGELSMDDLLANATRYCSMFLAKKMEYSGGYTKYITNNGYSNSDFPKQLETPAHLMVCLITLSVLGDRAAGGDLEAKRAIDIMIAFAGNAQENAKSIAALGHMEALRALGVDLSTVKIPGAPAAAPAAAGAKKHAHAGK